MNDSKETNLTADWEAASLVHGLYAGLAREFVIETPTCAVLESSIESPSQESLASVHEWIKTMDQHIQVHQLRQFLQTTALATNEGLLALLNHQLKKPDRSETDRDKIDFLLVQFFSHNVPSDAQDSDIDLKYVANVLKPAVGDAKAKAPDWLRSLEKHFQAASECRTLNELFTSGILEKGKKLKASGGSRYFAPAALVTVTRFNYLMRRIFFRLMHQDLNAILDGLRELEQRGQATLDCRRAQFSAEEPIARLRMICQSWKVMFQAEYSSGQPLRMLVDLRNVVDAGLSQTASTTGEAPVPLAKAAAASTASASSSEVPEFDVAAGPPSQEPDSSAGQ